MAFSRQTAVLISLTAISCRAPSPPRAIDPVIASRIPSSAIALAGIRFDQLRTSPLFDKVPAGFRSVDQMLVAFTGAEVLTISRTGSAEPALAGSPALVAAATAPHASPAVLAIAETVAAGHPIWMALRGGAPLPLTGNLANLNNLVRLADTITLTANVAGTVDLELTARCPSAVFAQQFEQRLRAVISLATAANKVRPAIHLTRDQQTVHATLSAPTETIAALAASLQ